MAIWPYAVFRLSKMCMVTGYMGCLAKDAQTRLHIHIGTNSQQAQGVDFPCHQQHSHAVGGSGWITFLQTLNLESLNPKRTTYALFVSSLVWPQLLTVNPKPQFLDLSLGLVELAIFHAAPRLGFISGCRVRVTGG